MKDCKRIIVALVLLLFTTTCALAQTIQGTVVDAKTNETLIGAMVTLNGTDQKTVTNIDGKFKFDGLNASNKYTLVITYVGYKPQTIVASAADGSSDLTVSMKVDEKTLNEVSVVGVEKKNNAVAMVQMAKNSQVTVSNISAQEIKLTQDSNAGEVIRRIPGVSIIEDKFVMVRGLSQRYNDVWINGGAVPSSEADSRAFSFDIIPSNQIDNLMIVKTPSPEYPADYSGGFIEINTKEIPSENSFSLQAGSNWNTQTAFKDFTTYKGSSTDFLGFDGGKRLLNGGMSATLRSIAGDGTDLLNNGFNNDWMTQTFKPMGDLKLGANLSRNWNIGGHKLGMIAVLNYSNEYRSYENMKNNLFGIYDWRNDRENYLRRSTDNQYNHNVRIGAMFNLTLLSRDGKNKYQLKNIFNQIGNSRYTWRDGIGAQSDAENSAEYYYRSRTTWNGQLTGKHTLASDEVLWNVGYAYANRYVPDRRRYMITDAISSDGTLGLMTGNDISREWTQLDEHIFSASVGDTHKFSFGSWEPTLKCGAYGEYRTREYNTREFIYNWNTAQNSMPVGFRFIDIPSLVSNSENFGEDRLYLLEHRRMRDDYIGHNTLGAGYLAATLPFGKLSVYAGVRFEHNRMELVSNTKDNEVSHVSTFYTGDDFFPSVNTTYKFNDKNQLRLSYGRGVNRPEFREVSSSVYYDFDLASDVQGNANLRNCYVDNMDLRYEIYPSRGEQISIAAFYKHFDSPIEWTYTVTGGTDLVYSYLNAKAANSYGLELDFKKQLDFIGLPDFSWSFNGSLIKSKVVFPAGAKEKDRPMQGQSPYLINSGLFYNNDHLKLNVALLYNRIGKRIIGVGRSEGTTSGNDVNSRVPDSYEMPRDVIDLTATKKFGMHWEVKLNVRDLLAQTVNYKQFADVDYSDGSKRKITEVARSYRPGRNVGLTAVYNF